MCVCVCVGRTTTASIKEQNICNNLRAIVSIKMKLGWIGDFSIFFNVFGSEALLFDRF